MYGEKISSNDQGYPSADLLQLLKITSFPILEKGTPYADSGTESADPELGTLFQVLTSRREPKIVPIRFRPLLQHVYEKRRKIA